MKMVKINGIEQTVPEGALLFDDYLKTLNDTLEKNNQVISSIRIKGKELSEQEEKNLRISQITDLNEIEIITKTPLELALDTLMTLDTYLDRIILSVDRAAKYYKRKNLVIADEYFSKAIDGMDLFVQTISGVKQATQIGLNSKIALVEAVLVSTMNDLLEAKRQNNYIFLAELLEKDLIENLLEWKEVAFPIFRAVKTS